MGLFLLLAFTFCYCHASPLQGQNVDCDDPGVFNAVDVALKELNREIAEVNGGNKGHKYALSIVLDASKTPGPGQNYVVRYQLKRTSCVARDPTPWQNCEFKPIWEGDFGECEAEVHIDESGERSNVLQKCANVTVPVMVITEQAGCLGCWQSISTKTLELLPIVRHAIQLHNNQSGMSNLFEAGEIVKAQRQVVAGWKYNLEYLARETNCSKDDFTDLNSECKALPQGHIASCVVDAFVDLNGELVRVDQKCILREKKNFPGAACPGCPQRIPTDSPELKGPLAAALEKYNLQCGGNFYYKIENITEASSQVVAGIIYRVHFQIKETNCSKHIVPKLSDDCQTTEDNKLLYCYASIYERPWTSEIQPKLKCGEQPQEETEGNQPLKKPDMMQLMRRPPGYTPFRTPGLALITGAKGDEPSGACILDFGSNHGSSHKHGHSHKHDHKKPKNKLKNKSSEESDEDKTTPILAAEIPEQVPNLDVLQQEEVETPQDSNGAPPSLFEPLPDLPEPPAPKCPGTPWKPIIALQEPSRDFTLEDLLPPSVDTAEPIETTPAPSQSISLDFDLTDAL
ncbi:kininogen-1 [Lacerta agilis]|uniref:kininogen-1 n=1 Tax=Lacerta agilis TaxID=80427 RepID=UPI0014194894|nr:kininogen-1 [Lacerta agilis]